jgi:hypothetical protein
VSGMRAPLQRLVLIALVLALAASAAIVSGRAQAQGKLEAHYTARLAGFPIGKGTWAIDIAEDHYTAAASAMTTGLLRVFTGGQATGATRGTLIGGQILTSTYSATIKTSRNTDEVQMTVNGGTVKDFKVDPPVDPDPERVPVTEAQRQGVMDPMTGSLVRMSGTGELKSPEVCQRNVPIFDGRLRYNLQFVFKRMDSVKADKGYAGPAVVCSVYFTPISGFIPSRAAIKYLMASRDIEVWLAPIAGTRVLVPFRAQLHTPIGLGVIEATHFVSAAQPGRAATKGAKTQ